MGKGRALVVAAWGYPPSWRKAKYRVGPPAHPAFRNARLVECSSCSNTLTLIKFFFFRENGWEVQTVIFGVDTALSPAGVADGREFRRRVKERFCKPLGPRNGASVLS